ALHRHRPSRDRLPRRAGPGGVVLQDVRDAGVGAERRGPAGDRDRLWRDAGRRRRGGDRVDAGEGPRPRPGELRKVPAGHPAPGVPRERLRRRPRPAPRRGRAVHHRARRGRRRRADRPLPRPGGERVADRAARKSV
ncbi:MAG: hypothetical protein AVDCRST_MAG64-1517, partial [uncultured Phycisphaerae bacterium]